MEKLRKIFAASVMLVTILSLSVVVTPAGAANVAKPGDLVKSNTGSTVYYLGADSKLYVFPNEKTYFSWYSDFSKVVVISEDELKSYGLPVSNITVRPGTNLVKRPLVSAPEVYAVEPDGKLRYVPDEATAKALWGNDWAKRVIDVVDSFFTNYKSGGANVTATAYPAGSLVKFGTAADIFYIAADGKARKFANEAAFSANGLNMANVVTATIAAPAAGTDIAGAEAALTNATSGAGGTAGAGTGLTVALSSNSAAAGTIIAGQAVANLGAFNFTASNDGAVKLTSVKLKRIGISADSDLSSVYLYDGNTRITDSASVSGGYITFNKAAGLATVDKGATKTLTVKANLASNSNGHTVGVAINALTDIVTDGAQVAGSFPVNANIMSVASATLASVAFNATTLPSADGGPAVQNDFTMWQNSVTIGERAVNLSYIAFRQIGSVASADVKNFRLFIDGTQVGSAVASLDANGYVAFDLSASPKRVETGSRTFKVVGDIAGGSTRTFSLSLRQASDIVIVDTEYNANVLATGTFPVSSIAQTVAAGSLTVTKTADSPSGNVIEGASGAVLARYTLKATGEAIKIETLKAGFTSDYAAIGSLRNGRLMANGVQVGSTASLVTTGTTYTVNYTVNPGTDVTLEVQADIFDDSGSNNATSTHTITASLLTGVDNAQGLNSLSVIDVPSADQAANQLTITTGTISLSKTSTYGNQTVVVPQSQDYKLASFTLNGNTTEDVNLNTITVDFTASGTFVAADDLSDVYVKHGADTTAIKATVAATGNAFSINKTVAKNGSLVIEVFGKIGSTITSGDSITTKMLVSGTTANSGRSVDTAPQTTGQIIVAGAGTIATAADATPFAKNVVGGATVDLANFKFTTTNDKFDLTQVTATTSANGFTALSNIVLKDGATIVATGNINSTAGTITFNMNGGKLAIAANTTKTLTANAALNTIGAGAGVSGASVQIVMTDYKANTSQGIEKTKANEAGFAARAGKTIFVYKSIPTFAAQTIATPLSGGAQKEIAKFTISADAAGEVRWTNITFKVSTSSNVTSLTNIKLFDETGTEVTAGSATTLVGTAIAFTAADEQTVSAGASGTKTYTLKADVAGTVVAGDFMATTIERNATHANPTTNAAVIAATATFVWSDVSAASHSLSTSDWNNEALTVGLPASVTVSK